MSDSRAVVITGLHYKLQFFGLTMHPEGLKKRKA